MNRRKFFDALLGLLAVCGLTKRPQPPVTQYEHPLWDGCVMAHLGGPADLMLGGRLVRDSNRLMFWYPTQKG